MSIAVKIAKRFGLRDSEIEIVGWLVANQSLFINTAFKRDGFDPETIKYLAKETKNLERLRLLLLMSVADVMAVGPKVWNGWKGKLMRDLYQATAKYISTGSIDLSENFDQKEFVENIQ